MRAEEMMTEERKMMEGETSKGKKSKITMGEEGKKKVERVVFK